MISTDNIRDELDEVSSDKYDIYIYHMHIRILSYSLIKYIFLYGLHTYVDNFNIFK